MSQAIPRFTLKSAAYLYLEQNGRIVLLKRANTGYHDGWYSMIAGHKDKGETLTQCIIREAQEEAGIGIQAADLSLIHIMHRYDPQKQDECYDFFFKATKWSGEMINKEPSKCDGIDWFDTQQLPENVIPYIVHFLENYQKGVLYSEFGWSK